MILLEICLAMDLGVESRLHHEIPGDGIIPRFYTVITFMSHAELKVLCVDPESDNVVGAIGSEVYLSLIPRHVGLNGSPRLQVLEGVGLEIELDGVASGVLNPGCRILGIGINALNANGKIAAGQGPCEGEDMHSVLLVGSIGLLGAAAGIKYIEAKAERRRSP
jgi:hypothetical protein